MKGRAVATELEELGCCERGVGLERPGGGVGLSYR